MYKKRASQLDKDKDEQEKLNIHSEYLCLWWGEEVTPLPAGSLGALTCGGDQLTERLVGWCQGVDPAVWALLGFGTQVGCVSQLSPVTLCAWDSSFVKLGRYHWPLRARKHMSVYPASTQYLHLLPWHIGRASGNER